MKHLATLLFSILFTSFTANAQIDCDFLLNNPSAVQALRKATRGDYKIELLTKQVGGKIKLVVLMGEAHIKTPIDAEIGKGVLQHFNFTGVEGRDPLNTWGGQLKNKTINPILEKIGMQIPQFWLEKALSKVFTSKDRTEDSTIYEAYIREMRRIFLNELKEKPKEELKELIARFEQEVPEEEVSEHYIIIEGIAVLTVQDLLLMAKSILNDTDSNPELILNLDTRAPIHLEKGHNPDVWENINSIEQLANWSILIAYLQISHLLPPSAQISSGLIIGTFGIYQIAGTTLKYTRYKAAQWYKRFFPLELANITGRNATMVHNIIDALENRDEISELLAIVGKNHVEEIKKLLEQEGYTSIPLPPKLAVGSDLAQP